MQTETLKQLIRSGGYAWPGGYPMALLMADGEVIDAQAARENYRLIRRETGKDWTPVDVLIHWEGEPLQCAHSGREIPSAYGEVE
jgi:hypothetical protein